MRGGGGGEGGGHEEGVGGGGGGLIKAIFQDNFQRGEIRLPPAGPGLKDGSLGQITELNLFLPPRAGCGS